MAWQGICSDGLALSCLCLGLNWQLLPPRAMQRILWRKLIVNAAINPIASVLNTPNGRVGACEWSRRCVDGVVREAMAVAAKEGVDLQCTEEVRLIFTQLKSFVQS